MVIRCVLLAALSCSFCLTVEAIQIGDSAELLCVNWAHPSQGERGDKTIWFYGGGAVKVKVEKCSVRWALSAEVEMPGSKSR